MRNEFCQGTVPRSFTLLDRDERGKITPRNLIDRLTNRRVKHQVGRGCKASAVTGHTSRTAAWAHMKLDETASHDP
jgi:hypothetical protein